MDTDSGLNFVKTKVVKKKMQSISKPDRKRVTKKSKTSAEAPPNPSQRVEMVEARNEATYMPQLIHSPQPPIKPITTLLCIPAYNEEKEIGPLIIKSKQYFDRILVCDDGSEDLMGQVAAGLGATVIRHETSLGRLATLRTLLERSLELDPAMILIMDVDPNLQPSEIPKILSLIKSREADVVFGTQQPNGTNRSETVDEDDLPSIFMAFSQKSLRAFLSAPTEVLESHSRILGIASGNGLILREVPIEIQREPFNTNDYETQTEEAPISQTGVTQQSKTQEKPKDQGTSQSFIITMSNKSYLFFGLPGLFALAIGISAGAYLLTTYLNLQTLSLPAAFVLIIGVISGLFLIMTSIILAAFSHIINNV
ncbi:MAG: glycosyltransferase family 2 protein [Candidatus Bathyarchaeia archaeon]|jgi:hypothetical protein